MPKKLGSHTATDGSANASTGGVNEPASTTANSTGCGFFAGGSTNKTVVAITDNPADGHAAAALANEKDRNAHGDG